MDEAARQKQLDDVMRHVWAAVDEDDTSLVDVLSFVQVAFMLRYLKGPIELEGDAALASLHDGIDTAWRTLIKDRERQSQRPRLRLVKQP